jgi:hypothetical protein
MGDEDFRLPLSSYEELVKIIRSYGHFEAEVPLPEIAKLAALHPTVVSRNNAFLVSLGVVDRGQRKVITPLGRALSRALDHNIADEVIKLWRQVVSPNPFFQKLLAAVRIRRGMDEATLQAHVAYSAGQKKSAGVMAGAAAVVEIMKIARLVVPDESGKLVALETLDEDVSSAAPPTSEGVVAEGAKPAIVTWSVPGVSVPPVPLGVSSPQSSGAAVNVTIQLNVTCTPDQLDEISDKVRNLIQRITSGPAE